MLNFLPARTALILTTTLILSAPGSLWAGDAAREQVVADALRAAPGAGKLIELKSADTTFVGLETPADPDRLKGAIVLLHDAGGNPNDQGLIEPLRTGLPQHGWTTLAIQLPISKPGAPMADQYALIAESGTRIDAALAWLKSGEFPAIALLGHGLGAQMACRYLADKQTDSEVKALIALSLPVPDSELPEADTLAQLKAIKRPLLDLYGSQDRPPVTRSAQRRAYTAKDENPGYRQAVIQGADHEFTGLSPALIRQINAWLTQQLNP